MLFRSWALLNGQELSRTVDADLFAVIGTTYGIGNGSTTFNVPNVCGRLLMGVGTGAGNGASGTGLPSGTALTAISRGDWKGSETHTLTQAQLPVITPTINDPGHRHGEHNSPHGDGVTQGALGNLQAVDSPSNNTDSSTTGITVNPFGGGQSHPIMPPVMGFNFLMRR